MPGIDPSIVLHEIKTYHEAKLVRQKLHPVHPKKTTTIKAEVEKLLKFGFIYPVPLTEWVSNIILVTKKKGQFKFVSTIGISIRLVRKTITLHPSSTKLSIIVSKASSSLLWMASQAITR
jgi:hypothetical protein